MNVFLVILSILVVGALVGVASTLATKRRETGAETAVAVTTATLGAGIGGVVGRIILGAHDAVLGIVAFEAVVAVFLLVVSRIAAKAQRA